PCSVREPQETRPTTGNARKQLTPSGFSSPFSASVSGTVSSVTPTSVASRPAGAFHTPRVASVRAKTPAIAPAGAYASSWFSLSGFGSRIRGKKIAEFLLVVPTPGEAMPALAVALLFQLEGASTSRNARRVSQYAAAAVQTALS